MRYKRSATDTTSVIRIINALYADYERREKEIRTGKSRINRFYELNNTLKASVDLTCEASIRDGMLFDLCHDIGYERSSLAMIMSHKTYYARKKAAKLEAARRLGLLESPNVKK